MTSVKLNKLNGKKVGLLGCGDIGIGLGQALLAQGAEIIAFRRNLDALPANFTGHAMDFSCDESLQQLNFYQFDYVVITLVPDHSQASREQAYQQGYLNNLTHILKHLDLNRIKRCFWVSSTSVYGQSAGEWVDETFETQPLSKTSQILVQAENMMRKLGQQSSIVRFSGIYRQRKHRLLAKLFQGSLAAKADTNYYSNRIHLTDCINILLYLLQQAAAGKTLAACYNATDSLPVDYETLVAWLSKQAGRPLSVDETAKTPQTNKRVSNALIRELGYQFIYPDYRSGFKPLIEQYQSDVSFQHKE